MLCQACEKKEATVHLTQIVYKPIEGHEPGTREQHFCQECADAHFASTPGMNSARGLICLSDAYRTKLYDLLEKSNPEAFDNGEVEACRRGSRIMSEFLGEHLKKDGIQVSGDAFDMLCKDFFCSHHFYTRLDDFKRRKR
jgi:protein-arginine kinase activator protein McsA